MTQYGTWVSYGGAARIWLAVGLLAAAGGLAYAGIRLPLPAWADRRPGKPATIVMLLAWAAAVAAILVCIGIYIDQYVHQDHLKLRNAAPPDRIFPVTAAAIVVVFIIILMRSYRDDGTRLASAAIGAIAGPMIFEFPFDLIVMPRTYPPIPSTPAFYPALSFASPYLVEITTLLLLRLSPMAKLTRTTFFSFALMLGVFAAWALSGFGYPSSPVPMTLNIVSKLLAFVTALTLFVPKPPPPAMASTATR